VSTNDYVKFVTQQIVGYINQPKEERKQKRIQRKMEQSPFVNRWFGILPFALRLLIRKNKRKY
jgi:hypothetical protein